MAILGDSEGLKILVTDCEFGIDNRCRIWYYKLNKRMVEGVPLPEKEVASMVTYGNLFEFCLVIIELATLIITIKNSKK